MPIKSLLHKAKALVSGPITPAAPEPGCILPDAPPEACGACDACPELEYPKSFQKIGIDETEVMWNGPKGWDVHFVVATGETDWIRDVAEIEGSIMEACEKVGKEETGGRRMNIAASNMAPPESYFAPENAEDKPTRVLVLPSFQILEDVRPSMVPALVREYVGKPDAITTTTPLDGTSSTTEAPVVEKEDEVSSTEKNDEVKTTNDEKANGLASAEKDTQEVPVLSSLSIAPPLPAPSPYPHDYVILLCSHKRRDARCGISAPILRKEFEKHLRPHGLYRDLTDSRPGGVGIYFVNHVGGHKFSGQVIIYSKKEQYCVWYGRVNPSHVKAIVDYTLLNNQVIDRTMVRAGYNRTTGVTSW